VSVPLSLRQDIERQLHHLTIPFEPNPAVRDIGDVSNETILALIGAAESGSLTARENLQQLQLHFSDFQDQACLSFNYSLATFLTC
jgi:hypothetical protein